MSVDADEVCRVLVQINAARRESTPNSRLEQSMEAAFSCQFKLAVYGSLAPGENNHHLLAELGENWSAALVTYGDLVSRGWGAAIGFPAIRWRRKGTPVAVHLLESAQLPQHWPRLDAFEGGEYCRVLVPLFHADILVTVANIYEAR